MDPTDENPYPYQVGPIEQQLRDEGILPPVGSVINALGAVMNAPPVLQSDGRRRLPSRAEVLAYREQVEAAGVPFELLRTLPDFEARVRRLSLADRAAIGSLPSAMQDRIAFLLNQSRGKNNADKPLTKDRLLTNVGRSEELANEFCKGGFVWPRLVESEVEITDEDTWLVTDVHVEDRVAYLNWCLNQDDTAGGRLKSFPSEPTSDLGSLSPNGRNA